MSGSVFSATLQTITSTKLEELAQQRLSFEKQYSDLLATARSETDPLKRLFLLVDGVKSCLGVKTVTQKNKDGRLGRVISGGTSNARLETDLKNLDRFLEQARYDPSVSPKVLQDWEESLLQYLSIQTYKYQYADLYGKLVTEWLSSEKATSTDGDIEMGESFEELPGAKKLEARSKWEKTVFEPAGVNVSTLNNYLDELFITDKKSATKAISTLRTKVEAFGATMTGNSHFSVSVLRWVIQGLQSSDLLSTEKQETLKDFLTNDVILGEVADVLNMRMGALSRWNWGDHVALEQRRNLNGEYSIHMDEDLLQAIFLHYIGVKWSVFFKKAFLALRQGLWKSGQTTASTVDRKRREYYLGMNPTYSSVQEERNNTHQKMYYVFQLLDSQSQRIEMEEGEEEAAFDAFVQPLPPPPVAYHSAHSLSSTMPPARQSYMASAPPPMPTQQMMHTQRQHQMRAQPQSVRDDRDKDINFGNASQAASSPPKKPIQAKQSLLHLLSTEIIVNTRLHGELTCFRSVFESWNPLLPHESIIAVLKFFGVPELWLNFFKTFLQAPLKFTDDKSGTPRPRQRGTPGSHALSDVFGEVLLFCLDFSVNQTTDGALLYRTYDDFWFWSPDYEKCAKAWTSVLQFTKVMGVRLSDPKTGSVRIAKGEALRLDDRLPQGEIRWGFLYLHPSTGRFEIDQKMVDSHVEELRKQLSSKSKSVIDWIQAWNSYAATFFSSNFGKAANCFGREHVDKMLATHRHIQESIFEGGNVVQFLKKTIEERFGVKEVPDGFLFFPVELGGLDLKSPFVGLLQIREAVKENPYGLLDDFEEYEIQDYEAAKKRFYEGTVQRPPKNYDGSTPFRPEKDADIFFPFEEFIRFREEFGAIGTADLHNTYKELMKRPVEESIDVSVQVSQALKQLSGQSNLKGITADWDKMEPYYKWVAQMYGPEMIERFGGLNVVDPGLLPIGMVGMFRQKRTKWQG